LLYVSWPSISCTKPQSRQITCLQWASGPSPAPHSHRTSRTIPQWHTITSTLYVIDIFVSAKQRAWTYNRLSYTTIGALSRNLSLYMFTVFSFSFLSNWAKYASTAFSSISGIWKKQKYLYIDILSDQSFAHTPNQFLVHSYKQNGIWAFPNQKIDQLYSM